jgi:AraC family transcriptional regulator
MGLETDHVRGGAETATSPLFSRLPRPLAAPGAMARGAFRHDTQFTQKWQHSSFHGYSPPMPVHVIGAIYSGHCAILRQSSSDGRSLTAIPGTVTIAPEGHAGHWEVVRPLETSQIFISEQRLQSCAQVVVGGKRVELLAGIGVRDPTSFQLLDLLSREASHYDAASNVFIEQALDAFCTHLIRRYCAVGRPCTPVRSRGLPAWQVRRVLGYMQEHLHEPIGLAELAAHINMSRFHFCAAVHLAPGQTPQSALTRQRMERAYVLLLRSDEPVTAIAGAVGYDSPSAFSAAFRRIMGSTPSQLRRRR